MPMQCVPVKLARQVLIAWVIALSVCLFAGLIGFAILNSATGPGRLLALGACLLIGILSAWVVLRALGETLGWLALGSASLELPQPLQLGVPLQARLVCGRPPQPGVLAVRVRCQTITKSRSGGKNQTSIANRWSAALPVSFGGNGLNLSFDLPADQPPSEPPVSSGTYHRWRLEVKKPGLAGFNFSVPLNVGPPPAEVVERQRQIVAAHIRQAVEQTLAGRPNAAQDGGLLPGAIKVQNGPEGLVLEFGAARNRQAALISLLVGVVFLGVPLLIAWLPQQGKAPPPFWFLAVFCAIGALLLAFGLYLAGQSQRTVVDTQGITTRSSWLLFSRTRRIEAGEVTELLTKSNMSVGETKFYTLLVRNYDRREIAIGSGIRGEAGAEYLKEVVGRKIGKVS